jgi:hypothetical protein
MVSYDEISDVDVDFRRLVEQDDYDFDHDSDEVSNHENIQSKQVRNLHVETDADNDDNFVFNGQKVQSKFLKQVIIIILILFVVKFYFCFIIKLRVRKMF